MARVGRSARAVVGGAADGSVSRERRLAPVSNAAGHQPGSGEVSVIPKG